jgi:hypothetical protein
MPARDTTHKPECEERLWYHRLQARVARAACFLTFLAASLRFFETSYHSCQCLMSGQ